MISALIERGVRIPCPSAVVLEDIDVERIQPGAVIYPGCILRGRETYIGRNALIGEGGGALVENAQIGAQSRAMQGVYRECTLLDGVIVRNGAEIREGCLLEEGVELGHTVGLKQTIFFPHVVAGSLINFCDALMAGGLSRKVHSEIGSCMALYNYTPQGDKFASIFGNVVQGVFLNQRPIFIGGQTQIVSPVIVGFGAVVGAGSKITKNILNDHIVCTDSKVLDKTFEPEAIHRPDVKVENTLYYIEQLEYLKLWYQQIRLPLFRETESSFLMESGLKRIESGLTERRKRLSKFSEKLAVSLEYHRECGNTPEIAAHEKAIELVHAPAKSLNLSSFPVCGHSGTKQISFEELRKTLREKMSRGMSYCDAVSSIE